MAHPGDDELAAMATARTATSEAIVASAATAKVIVAGPGTRKTRTFGKARYAAGGEGLPLTFIRNLVADLDDALGDVAGVCTFYGAGGSITRRGLRKGKAPSGKKQPFRPRTPKRQTEDWDPEDIAIEAVRQALWQIDENEMEDGSRLRGLGADGLRDDEYIELKRNRCGLPTSITVDANEFERARIEHERFVLASLTTSTRTCRQRFASTSTRWRYCQKLPQTSVTLGGFTSTPALEVTFNTTDPDQPPAGRKA